jgi:RimJ/RimL family protein N-acetyltransferase
MFKDLGNASGAGSLRPFWRVGCAKEASLACGRYAFERIGVSRIVTLIHQENRPPIRLAQRCGLSFKRFIEKDGATAVLYTPGADKARRILAERRDDVRITRRPDRGAAEGTADSTAEIRRLARCKGEDE